LLVQNVSKYDFDIACVSESAGVQNPRWFSSVTDRTAAIYIGSANLRGRCSLVKAGLNYVIVSCDRYQWISVYLAPSLSPADFHTTLDELSAAIGDLGGRNILVGDFNAKSLMWGSAFTNWRRSAVERWGAELDLVLINSGSTPTYASEIGESIIDLTWVTADVCRLVSGWRVLSNEESLSDHRYIVFRFGDIVSGSIGRLAPYSRWNTKTLDRDLFVETVDWLGMGNFPRGSVEDFSSSIVRMVSTTCNVSAQRMGFS